MTARAILKRVRRLETAAETRPVSHGVAHTRSILLMQRLAVYPDLFREFAGLSLAPSMTNAAAIAAKLAAREARA